MKNLVLGLVAVTSFLGAIGGALALRYSILTIVILSLLKITGIIAIPWFAPLGIISAVGTGLWMLFIGLILYVIGLSITFVTASSLD